MVNKGFSADPEKNKNGVHTYFFYFRDNVLL